MDSIKDHSRVSVWFDGPSMFECDYHVLYYNDDGEIEYAHYDRAADEWRVSVGVDDA